MNNKTYYTTPQAVIDFNTQYYKKHKTILEFPTSLSLMLKEGLLSENELLFPVLNATMTTDEFIHAYNSYPLAASNHFNKPLNEDFIDETNIFPKGRDVFCIRHERMIGPHRFYYNTYFAIAYIYTGSCKLVMQNERTELKAGDICIIPPGLFHYFFPSPGSFVFGIIVRSSSFNIVFNDILIPDNDISNFFRDSVIYHKKDNFAVISTDTSDNELRVFFQALAIECLQNNLYDNSCAISLLKIILANACRKYSEKVSFYKDIYSHTKPDATAIMHFIQWNYKTINLKSTAEAFHYNESYLSRLIQEYFGRSFIDLLNEVKIDHAKKALESSDMKISDVAINSGFSSKDHFSRTFKKWTGISPSDYRARNRHRGQ